MKFIKKNIILLMSSLFLISTGCKKENAGLLPVIETSVLLELTSVSTANSGGTITSEGSSKVKARGVCWSLKRNPTISDPHSEDGAGAGVFESKIHGMQPFATYYIRAYATNNEGTSYGSEKSITTKVSIGEFYKGGIVYDVSDNGEIFICSELDQSEGIIFGEVKRLYTTSGLSLKESNDTIISNTAETSTIAATLCKDLNLNGYNDWLLPSANDWSKIRKNLVYKGLGNFSNGSSYWSSTIWIKSQTFMQQTNKTNVIYCAELDNNVLAPTESTIPLSSGGSITKRVRAVRIEK